MTVITISRQYGSGGTEVAQRVADILGYQYLDKEVIARVAEEAGLTDQEVLEFREDSAEGRNFLERLLTPGPPQAATMALRPATAQEMHVRTLELLDSEKCLHLIRSVVHAEYKRGNAVIVGRGGQAVLQDLPGTLHVYIHAAMPTRILNIQRMEGVDMERAYHSALQHDKVTSRYLDRVFGIRWEDPQLYHLMLNATKLSIEQAAQIIVQAARLVEAG
ncbi:MAG: cytidylate kinase-like family protein [Caldilineales bacterium]|nr:cytidylate kinase-like family protein [Caldilineales bacterium]MDW8318469.1 cytidylate kinase-like family protein [Anaerolineae bacterium]